MWLAVAGLAMGCGQPPPTGAATIVLAGQALIKVDPRAGWDAPFESLLPVLESADVAFTNFEAAVNGPHNECAVPPEYVTVLGRPRLGVDERPGNSSSPHAVAGSVMQFLASVGFNLVSLSNNHIWDLGPCGVQMTRVAARQFGLVGGGVGANLATATRPVFVDVAGYRIGLVAATTSHDERHLLRHSVNGIWIGRDDDRQRNLSAVRDAAAQSDFVIFYHHFQLGSGDLESLADGESDDFGHLGGSDPIEWRDALARDVIDAGASVYLGHGRHGFDGIETYRDGLIIRQLGGLAYQGKIPVVGHYDHRRSFWGLLLVLTLRDGVMDRAELVPLLMDEGADYQQDYSETDFLGRRGFPEVATGWTGAKILERARTLSSAYGTRLRLNGDRARLRLP